MQNVETKQDAQKLIDSKSDLWYADYVRVFKRVFQKPASGKHPDAGFIWKHIFPETGHPSEGGMCMTDREYGKLVQDMAPKSPILKDCINAFWIGGLICTLGQLILNGFTALGLEKTDAATATSISLVALSVFLTGLSLYDNIAKHAGAGTLVPITGFANAVAAPAIEFKTEGFILGVGAKMFTIAGPVIVYGVSASVVYGLIYWITTLI